MISWMQRKRKYLVITIWISTIAFVGAGFVGWGAYSYGSKASSIAQVGEISVTADELQTTYSNLFSYYNRMFQGKFDQETAKKMGLEQQAIHLLLNQAMLLNLAKQYELTVLDSEVRDVLFATPAFQNSGQFDKESYIAALDKVGLSPKEYEKSLKKELLLRKLDTILAPTTALQETQTLKMAFMMADKLSYKVINANDIKVAEDAEEIKAFWEPRKENYLTQKMYAVEYFWQEPVTVSPSDAEIEEHYAANKFEYKNENGEIKPLEEAKDAVVAALRAKATKKAALIAFVAYKKGEIDPKTPIETATITDINLEFPQEVMGELAQMDAGSYMKPKAVGDRFVTMKLLEVIEPKAKSFEAAYDEVKAEYERDVRKRELANLAQAELEAFNGGKTTDFVGRTDYEVFGELTTEEASEFLNTLFLETKGKGIITLENKAIVYKILEQSLLNNEQDKNADAMISKNALEMKKSVIDSGLLKQLESSFPTEIYYKGQ